VARIGWNQAIQIIETKNKKKQKKMNTLETLLEGTSKDFNEQYSVAKSLVGKWSKSGLLKNLDGYEKMNMASLLENQAKRLVVENAANFTGGNSTTGATFLTGVGEQWAGVALPLVRKIFGMIAAKEFYSVQPMNLPAGLIFYLNFQYVNGKSPFEAGTSVYGIDSENFGNLAEGGLYGAGRFGYSLNQFSASVAYNAAGVSVASASFADCNFDTNFSGSVKGGTDAALTTVKRISIPTSSLPDFNELGVRAFVLTSGSISAADNFQAFTRVAGGNLLFFVSASTAEATAAAGGYTVFYNKQTDFNKRGDFEDTSAAAGFSVPNAESNQQIVIPEIKIQMESEGIVAKTRKLKAEWTPELAQDIQKFQNIDAEAELTNMLGEYIALEIDLELLDILIQKASAGTEVWSAVSNKFWTPTGGSNFTSTLAAAGAGGYYNTQGEWFQTLGTKIQKISNIIHQRTLRGGANLMMVSPSISTILESIPGFAADVNGDTESMKYAFGVQKVGQLNSRYKVFKNPYLTENLILLGLRGSQFLETGAVYAPYVPVIMTPLVYDPETFTPRKGLMTRYATKVVRPEFFGKIYVTDLNTI
jgi:hypothetical protein